MTSSAECGENGGLISSPPRDRAASTGAMLHSTWSDGHLEVTKHFRLIITYVIRVKPPSS